jgi:hypothetical protein
MKTKLHLFLLSLKRNARSLSLCALAAWLSIFGEALHAQPTDVSGTIVNATWTLAGSPYIVVGNINVAGLTIQPGVQVIFQTNYAFEVDGNISAVGTAAAPIVFMGTNGGWQGIYFNFANPGSVLDYCVISNSVNSGIRDTNTSLVLSNCFIANNTSPGYGGGVWANLAPSYLLEVVGCVISNNVANPSQSPGTFGGGGLAIGGPSKLLNCVVQNNTCHGESGYDATLYSLGGGFYTAIGTAVVENCIFTGNTAVCGTQDSFGSGYPAWGGGIYIGSGSLAMTNSIVSSNVTSSAYSAVGGGLAVNSGTGVTACSVVNCTIAYNNTQGIYSGTTVPLVMNSIVYFNYSAGTQIAGVTNVTYSDVQYGIPGLGNINLDPVFQSTSNLIIVVGSPCIDAGNFNPAYNDTCFPPSLGTALNDIGAHGGPGACNWGSFPSFPPAPNPPATAVQGIIVNAIWTAANSPYEVVGNTYIAGLTIQPGVQVIFESNYVFEVDGTLTAVGTAAAPIVFMGTNGWQGIYFNFANPGSILDYCVISNSVNSGIRDTNTSLVVSNCLIANNTAPGYGGGVWANLGSNYLLQVVGCLISNNVANPEQTAGSFGGGGLAIVGPTKLQTCVVQNNTCHGVSGYDTTLYSVGGGLYIGIGPAVIENCIFTGNTAVCGTQDSFGSGYPAWGGGIFIGSGSLAMSNSILSSNVTSSAYSSEGGGLFVNNGTTVTACSVVNCTIAYNNTQGIYSGTTVPLVMNTILYFNASAGTQITGLTNVTYCDVQGGFSGLGNINFNPLFATNLAIVEGSRCIDAGNPATNYNDACFPPSLGTTLNDIGADGGPGACGWPVPPPILLPIPNTNINELVLWQYTPTVSASGFTFGLSNAPSGMTVNTNSGTISWTPSQAQATYTFSNITFIVYQSGNSVASTSFDATVNDINGPPVLNVPGQQSVILGSTMTVTNTATNSDIWATSITFGLVSAPAGVALNTNTGVLTWTPISSQSLSTNTITISATDYDPYASNSLNLSVTNSFTVVVINPAVSILATSPNASDLGPIPGVFTVTRSGGTNGPLMVYYNLSGTASNGVDYSTQTSPVVIPAGALSAAVTVTPILYSSPNSSSTVVMNLSASSLYDLGSPNAASITITQIPPPMLIVPSPSTKIVDLGSNLAVSLSVVDSYISTNQFAFTNVSSPSGVNVNPVTGLLTWTPASVSTNTIIVGVYDVNAPGYEATNSFTVVVTPAGLPPTNVTILPFNQTVFEGATAGFSATAGGTAPFAYQWFFTNTPIAGATNATLTLTNVQLTNAGSYMVAMSNPYGSATNLVNATLGVSTFTATHASQAYGSPGICTVSCRVNYALDRSLVDLLFEPALPQGWTLQSVSGAGEPYIDSGDIKFNSVALPNPLNFSYTATVPAGQSEPQSITDTAGYLLSGMTLYSYYQAAPNPLIVSHCAFLTFSVSNNELFFTLFGDSGSNYVLQASADLINWSNLTTAVPINGLFQTNEPITGGQLFYRTMLEH